ncbi:MAG: sulfatase-like hydrolase/transferase [Planctomycetota bacterium]
MTRINRRKFLQGSAAAATSLVFGQGCNRPKSSTNHQAQRDRRPNVVVIITDDQRYDSLSCEGHPFLKTPNMDRIANQGPASPTCSLPHHYVRPAGHPCSADYTHTPIR